MKKFESIKQYLWKRLPSGKTKQWKVLTTVHKDNRSESYYRTCGGLKNLRATVK